MIALVTAEEAQALLDDYAAGLMPDGPERPEFARAVVAQAADLDGLRAEVRRADDERAAWRERVETAERERDAAQWSAMATRQDIEQLARVVGRTSIELVLERVVDGHTVTQTPSAHVLADGRAYAPILGASVPASASLRDLIGAVEKAFGDGFKCASTRPIGGGR